MKKTFSLLLTAGLALQASSQSVEPIKYGNFNSWITREIKESAIIGGKTRPVYEIGPTKTIIGAKPYFNGDSPWGTSNVYANVSGITKTSNAVFPSVRSGSDKCAKLTAMMERVKVLGLINMDVMVAGSIFLGEIIEPITSTKNPYSKMEMGMPYTKRPKYLVFDYMAEIPAEDIRVKATGFGSPQETPRTRRGCGIRFPSAQMGGLRRQYPRAPRGHRRRSLYQKLALGQRPQTETRLR